MHMKTKYSLSMFLVALAAGGYDAHAQTFTSGSDGSYGPIDTGATTLTLDVPPDGIFHCTTIDVRNGGILRFQRNDLNTPVYLLATGDVNIFGTVDVSGGRGTASIAGQAGPGGFDGGAPGSAGLPSGDGQGPGGGKGGTSVDGATEAGGAGHATQTTQGPVDQRGGTYGSPLLLQLEGGSGGGGVAADTGWGGGGGGGAILVASDSSIRHTGTIAARGGTALSGTIPNTGSGGSVRLVAPVVFGNGWIEVFSCKHCLSRRLDGRVSRTHAATEHHRGGGNDRSC